MKIDEDFLSEVEELIESLSRGLLQYEKALESGKRIDLAIMNSIFRDAHTIKGNAGMFGFQDMGTLAHGMEDLLDCIRKDKVIVEKVVIDLLFESAEQLVVLLQSDIKVGNQINGILQKLKNVTETKSIQTTQTSKLDELNIPADILDVLSEYEECRLLANAEENINIVIVVATFSIDNFDTLLPQVTKSLEPYGEIIARVPSTDESNPEKMIFKLIYATSVRMEKIEQVFNEKGYGLVVLKMDKLKDERREKWEKERMLIEKLESI